MPQACGSCPGPWFEVIGYFEPIPEEEHSDKANKLKLPRHSLSIQRYKQEQCLLLQSRSVQFYWGKSQNLMVDHASVVYPLFFGDKWGVNHPLCGPIPVQPKDGITFVNKLV